MKNSKNFGWLISRFLPATVALIFFTSGLPAQELFVDSKQSGSGGDGSSWDEAALSLRDALDSARPGTTIHLAEGLYYPDEGRSATNDDVFASFTLAEGITLLGGYEPEGRSRDRDPEIYRSILSGDITQTLDADRDGIVDGFSGTRSVSVVVLSESNEAPEIDGVIITGGASQAISGSLSGLTLRHSVIRRCGARAVSLGDPATDPVREVLIEDCSFLDNGSGAPNASGGGLAVTGLDLTIRCSEFRRNFTGLTFGGAISITANENPNDAVIANIQDCRIKGNRAINGGGVATLGRVNLALTNTVLSGNRAGNFGVPTSSGGAIHKRAYQNTTQAGTFNLIHCTIAWNFAGGGPGGIRLNGSGSTNITNTILFQNFFGQSNSAPESGILVVSNSANPVQPTYRSSYDLGESLVGNGNFDSFAIGFPEFAEDVPLVFSGGDVTYEPTDAGDLRQLASSTLVNGGDNGILGGLEDIDGEPRIANGITDLGAYEIQILPAIQILSVETESGQLRISFDATVPVDVYASEDLTSFPGPPVATGIADLFETPLSGSQQFFVLVPAGTTP